MRKAFECETSLQHLFKATGPQIVGVTREADQAPRTSFPTLSLPVQLLKPACGFHSLQGAREKVRWHSPCMQTPMKRKLHSDHNMSPTHRYRCQRCQY